MEDVDIDLIDFSENSDDVNKSPSNPATDIPQTPSSYAVLPCLKGLLYMEKSGHVCRGFWAMSDSALEVSGQTSEFEFRLVDSVPENYSEPISGKYTGWFMLQQPPPRQKIKIEDKEINIKFTSLGFESPDYRIQGEGYNKFGRFTVNGTLSGGNVLCMYRSYLPKPSPSSAKPRKSSANRSTPTAGFNKTSDGKSSKVIGPNASYLSDLGGDTQQPVLNSSRNRRPSAISTNYSVTGDSDNKSNVNIISNDKSNNNSQQPAAPLSSKSQQQASKQSISNSEAVSRTHRLSQHMLKCADILKDLTRQPQAIWFNEPVDYVKLNIPDYPTIIKEPMDFKTIRTNLERSLYDSPESFAEHVRLTFRNAITYNQLRDNPVHIAAREMSNRFEEKYRIMISQMGTSDYISNGQNASSGRYEGGDGSSGTTPKRSKKSNLSNNAKRVSNGPRILETGPPPPAIDGNMHALLEMQKKMQEMQNEILQLRTAVKHTEIKQYLEPKR